LNPPARFRSIFVLGVALTAVATLPGCIAVVAGAGGTAAGYELGQDRSLQDQGTDALIRSNTIQAFSEVNYDLPKDVEVTVYVGRVLLTGRVPDENWHREAVRRARQVASVREVFDQIKFGPPQSINEQATDQWITTQLRSRITLDMAVRSVNYSITTFDGTVYLMGSARSQTELDYVIDGARRIAHVAQVISFVRIREGMPGGTQPPLAPPPPGLPPDDRGASPAPFDAGPGGRSSGNAIEVTPLR
jgi:osmotically-inducible protein OsmY